MGRVEDEATTARKQVSARTHPVRVLLDASAGGYVPTAADYGHVTQSAYPSYRAAVRQRLAEAADEAVRLYSAGAHGNARRLATTTAFELAPYLGATRRSAGLFEDAGKTPPAAVRATAR